MKGKLSLAAVAVAVAMLAVPATASAHFDKRVWSRVDGMFGWMHRGLCHKVWAHKHHWHHKRHKHLK